jgi:hypothetical protein
MKCPHCLTAYHDEEKVIELGEDASHGWVLVQRHCPECKKFIFHFGVAKYGAMGNFLGFNEERLVYPKGAQRPAPSPEVPKLYAEDYVEACLVIPDSPKASAALSRRCLQNLLRSQAKVKHGDLANEIQQVLDAHALPSHLAESVDAIRNIGNFAAHPIKSTSSGDIVPVEPGEAEWTLDVLEGLFDFYFVQPALLKKKRAALDAKLTSAGKKPMK